MDQNNHGRIYNELLRIRLSLKNNKRYDSDASFPDVISNNSATVSGYQQQVKEVSEREKFEKELNLSRELFFKIFNCSPLLMAITTPEDFRYIDVNEAFLQAAGYIREEVVDRTVVDINILSEEEFGRFNSLIKQGAARNLDFTIRTSSGEMRPVTISTEYIDFNNQKCILWEMKDVTELKSLQQELTRLGQLNLVGEMAASIGHEIRNPMTTARGFLQMLGGKPECTLYKEYFDLIIEELDRANTIVTEFLSMAQVKPNSVKKENLTKIVETLLPLIKADALIRDVSVEAELEKIPDLPLIEREIRQLILNLARNGLESMSSGGIMRIHTYLEESEIVLSVQDQGTGIKPEIINKLGTPFLTTKENGTGLGLTVCYSIASRQNAVINFDTGPEGTTFYVRFKTQALP